MWLGRQKQSQNLLLYAATSALVMSLLSGESVKVYRVSLSHDAKSVEIFSNDLCSTLLFTSWNASGLGS